MGRKSRFRGGWFTAAVAVTLVVCASAYAAMITVTCRVTDDFSIITEKGTVYEIADTYKGDELLFHTGKKLRVTGIISDDDANVIEVTSFTVLEE